MAGCFVVTLVGETLHRHYGGLLSWDTEHFTSVQLQMEDGFEMAGLSVVTLREETAWLLWRSPGTEIFELEELYLGDDLEREGSFAVIQGKRLCQ